LNNYYTTAEQRRKQNQWRRNSYGVSLKEEEDVVARKNAEKELERQRREAEREAERQRKEAERQAQREAERIRREEEREAERQRKEAEKAQTEANARQEKYERERLIAQKRQEQKEAQGYYTGTPSPSVERNYVPEFKTVNNVKTETGKATPTPSLESRLWKSEGITAKEANDIYTPERVTTTDTNTSFEWKTLNGNNTPTKNSNKDNFDLYEYLDSFPPFTGKLKEIQDQYEFDLDMMWARYGKRLMGLDDKPAQQTAKSKTVSKGSNREMGEVFTYKSPVPKNPVIQYTDMINPPSNKYRKNDEFWRENESVQSLSKMLINNISGIKSAEIDRIVDNPIDYIPHAKEMMEIRKSEKSAANTRNKVFTEYIGGYDGYGLNIDGGRPNAFLHIYTAAKSTDVLGERAAREFLTAHETFTDIEYLKGILYKQDDISFDTEGAYQQYQKYSSDKKYPWVKHHVEMDLHNNDIGIQIALSTPDNPEEIVKQLEIYLWEGETVDGLRTIFKGYSDREILFIKKAICAIYGGEASVIWDYPGNNLPE